MIRNQNPTKLTRNLSRISSENHFFNYSMIRNEFPSMANDTLDNWIGKLLPNTRLIIEPLILGCQTVLFYKNGCLTKGFYRREYESFIDLKRIRNIPHQLHLDIDVKIRGQIYHPGFLALSNNARKCPLRYLKTNEEELNFCSFQIINSDQNHYQSLIELKKLGFEVPSAEFTTITSPLHMYLQLFKARKIFEHYPAEGIVLKVNSRKLQKQMGENNLFVNWAYAVK